MQDSADMQALFDIMLPIFLKVWVWFALFGVITYVYMAFSLQSIARNTNTENSWFAWLPVMNFILMCDIAGKPRWWTVFFFIFLIPVVGPMIGGIASLVVSVILWMKISGAAGASEWWGLTVILPGGIFFLQGFLAFSGNLRLAVFLALFLVLGGTGFALSRSFRNIEQDFQGMEERFRKTGHSDKGNFLKPKISIKEIPAAFEMKKQDPVDSFSRCTIQGIVYSEGSATTMINGNAYHVNETVCEGKITNISPDDVTLVINGGEKRFAVGETIKSGF